MGHELDRFLPAGTTAEQMRAFAMRFESLGGHWLGCEFGQIQRVWRAEPISLLRWAAMWPGTLTAALQNGFAGVGEPAHTEFFRKGAHWWTRDVRWHMDSNSFMAHEDVSEDNFRASASRRLIFLRDKLLSDLCSPDKIFVFKMTDRVLSDAELSALNAAMRRYGSNWLLYVTLADDGHPDGTAEHLGPGLLRGYIDRFAAGANGEDCGGFNAPGWYNVLSAALAIRDLIDYADEVAGRHEPADPAGV